MKRAVVVRPTGFLGKEIREVLAESDDGWETVKLLSTQEEEIGTVTEVLGRAAFVERYEPDEVLGCDVVFLCGPAEENNTILSQWTEAAPLAVVLSPDTPAEVGPPAVSGLPLPPRSAGVVVSPHPAVVQLALLLYPLASLGLEQAVATVALPASIHGEEALGEILDQTRRLLAFQPLPEGGVFSRQIAFNLAPVETDTSSFVAQLDSLLAPRQPAVSLDLVQAGVFHCLFASLYVRFEPDPGTAEILEILEDSPNIRLGDDLPGPVESAASSDVLVASVRSDPRPGSYWISSTMDNLTRGSALNAYEAALAILARF